jgi:acyl-coenzyme A thioesterase PaaI-like protein
MEANTHLKINNKLCGQIVELKENYAKVALQTTEDMVADHRGLIHGSFAFGGADYCAMLVINDPNVVLSKSETTFLAPVKCGQEIIFEGQITESNGHKNNVYVTGFVNDKEVFEGIFKTVILKKHVFDL